MAVVRDAPTPFQAAQWAASQWDRRTVPDTIAPETAWEEARPMWHGDHPLPVPRVDAADEVRYHDITETVLVRVAARITEIRSLKNSEIETAADIALRNEIEMRQRRRIDDR